MSNDQHDDGKGDKDPKTVDIFVNTKPYTVPKGEISFETVTKLATRRPRQGGTSATRSRGNAGTAARTVPWSLARASR